MRKKLLFAAYSLDVGGIETSLISLMNYISKENYDITLVLEKKQGLFLKQLPESINILEYTPSVKKNVLIRKFSNLFKRIKFISKYKNKFDFSASFATYSKMCSFVARVASKKNVLWIHTDYLTLFDGDALKVKEFFNTIEYDKFKKILFVSNKAKNSFLGIFPELEDKVLICKNLIDYDKILKKSEEKIEEVKQKDKTVFLNVGRHDELSKKLTKIIEASYKLKQENYKFQVLFIGNGMDTDMYKELVKEKGLEDTIIFLGEKENPYPYFKISDAIILTSDYEGYPVVFNEAMTLNLPIITTNVSDSMEDVNGKYGFVTNKNIEDIYLAMKKFIDEGYIIKEKFNPEEYNKEIIKTLKMIID